MTQPVIHTNVQSTSQRLFCKFEQVTDDIPPPFNVVTMPKKITTLERGRLSTSFSVIQHHMSDYAEHYKALREYVNRDCKAEPDDEIGVSTALDTILAPDEKEVFASRESLQHFQEEFAKCFQVIANANYSLWNFQSDHMNTCANGAVQSAVLFTEELYDGTSTSVPMPVCTDLFC